MHLLNFTDRNIYFISEKGKIQMKQWDIPLETRVPIENANSDWLDLKLVISAVKKTSIQRVPKNRILEIRRYERDTDYFMLRKPLHSNAHSEIKTKWNFELVSMHRLPLDLKPLLKPFCVFRKKNITCRRCRKS